MSENIQTQFKSEGQPLHDTNTENDNSTDSSTETNETDQTQSHLFELILQKLKYL